jgi:hypothetical protein
VKYTDIKMSIMTGAGITVRHQGMSVTELNLLITVSSHPHERHSLLTEHENNI